MDATVFGIHAKQNTTRRCGRDTKYSAMFQSFCCSTRKIVQEKHIRRFAKVCHPQEGQVILQDIHAGVCGHHASSRAIAAKAFRGGFYWLTTVEDAKDIVR
jgi:hypothetical protein